MGGKRESFRIFEDADFHRCYYPSVANASPHTKHLILGPDLLSQGVCWTIGEHSGDQAENGKRFEVRLFVDEFIKPERVDWLPVRGIDGLEDARGRGFFAFGS